MILLFSDFGWQGPYVGEMRAAAMRAAPGVAVCDLMHDAPRFDPRRSAYLLASLVQSMPAGDIVVAVVDPGVGTEREPLAIELDSRWLIGPDNGLFEIVIRRSECARCWRIAWRPERLSSSFHGRDLFAPFAGKLAEGRQDDLRSYDCLRFSDWPDDLPEIVYVDGYGNLVSGLRAEKMAMNESIEIGGHRVSHADTFAAVPPSHTFWYGNSAGLVEIASNHASAATLLGVGLGAHIARRNG